MLHDGYVVGSEVEIECERCKTVRQAQVMSVVGGRPAQVRCKHCHRIQPHRSQDDQPVPKKGRRVVDVRPQRRFVPPQAFSPTQPSAPRKLSPERARWEELTDNVSSTRARVHNEDSDNYEVGELILHKSYGMGVIEAIDNDTRELVVLFRNGVQRLSFNRAETD